MPMPNTQQFSAITTRTRPARRYIGRTQPEAGLACARARPQPTPFPSRQTSTGPSARCVSGALQSRMASQIHISIELSQAAWRSQVYWTYLYRSRGQPRSFTCSAHPCYLSLHTTQNTEQVIATKANTFGPTSTFRFCGRRFIETKLPRATGIATSSTYCKRTPCTLASAETSTRESPSAAPARVFASSLPRRRAHK